MQARKDLRRHRMMRYFIEAAEELIQSDGLKNLTIRNVTERAGYSSATLYNYFDDLDELIMFTAFKFRRGYMQDLSREIKPEMNALEQFIRLYEIFCYHSFRSPDIYMTLFFGRHSRNYKDVFQTYYKIFPEELTSLTTFLSDVLMQNDIWEIDRAAVHHLVAQGYIKAENQEQVANLTVRMHESYLYDMILDPKRDPDLQRQKFMEVLHHIINTN